MPRPQIPYTEGEEVSAMCKRGNHRLCRGWTQYRNGKPPKKCVCECHSHDEGTETTGGQS